MKLVPARKVEREDWDAFVKQHPDGWFWHTYDWVLYQRAYLQAVDALDVAGSVPTSVCVDASFAIIDESTRVVLGLVPLFVKDGIGDVDGRPAPIYVHDSVAKSAAPLVADMAHRIGLKRWVTSNRPTYAGRQKIAPPCTRVIDLAQSEQELWKSVRHSYRSLIHNGERAFTPNWYQENAGWAVFIAQMTHAEAAGRVTRSQETWNLMRQWVDAGHAFVVLGQSKGTVRGYAYVICYKDWAYYASGASLEPNVSHAIQWSAIRCAAQRGINHYEVGYLPDNPTEKDLNIQKFKSGFGGIDWPVRISNVQFNGALQKGESYPGAQSHAVEGTWQTLSN